MNNPTAADPTSPPTSISFPTGIPNPFPSGIPVLPDNCNSTFGAANQSSDCLNTLSGSGGYLYFDSNSGCSQTQMDQMQTAVWDATTLAMYSSNFPSSGEGTRGQASGIFYMGPDFAAYQNRIAGNLKRAWQFKTDSTSGRVYIYMSCNDPKVRC